MGPSKSLCVLIVFFGSFIGPFACLWVFVGPYRSLCVHLDSSG